MTYTPDLGTAIEANRELRDDKIVHPECILVFTEATGTLEEVAFIDLPLLFPLKGKGARCSYEDLGELLAAKSMLYCQSKAANELVEEHPDATPECGTVCLVQHTDQHVLSWCQVRARIDPALNHWLQEFSWIWLFAYTSSLIDAPAAAPNP